MPLRNVAGLGPDAPRQWAHAASFLNQCSAQNGPPPFTGVTCWAGGHGGALGGLSGGSGAGAYGGRLGGADGGAGGGDGGGDEGMGGEDGRGSDGGIGGDVGGGDVGARWCNKCQLRDWTTSEPAAWPRMKKRRASPHTALSRATAQRRRCRWPVGVTSPTASAMSIAIR